MGEKAASAVSLIWISLKSLQPRKGKQRHPPIRANTADEAIEKMLEQKKISSKINYDVLKDLNIKPSASPARQAKPQRQPSPATKPAGLNRNPARASLSLSTPLNSLGKRLVYSMFRNCVQVH